MRRNVSLFLSILVINIFAVSAIFAQVTGGAVTGTVVDSNSAIIPSVTVRLEDKQRGTTLTTQTTGSGSYSFPNVPVGEYTIVVEQSGFAPAKQNLVVSLNQTTTVDVTLKPTADTATVDVTSGSDAVVVTDSSQIGKSFDTRKVQDLPIAGNANNLALLSANTAARSAGTVGSGATVGGVRPRGNTFNVDGVDNNDASVTGVAANVIQDAIAEFTLLQNNFNAEFGAGAGGQFNTITKSGTNNIRGSAFTYIDSQRFNARTTAEDGRAKDFFKQARYGGTVGGPIIKNKLFAFGAYERFYLEQPGAVDQYLAPTSAGLDQIAALPGASPFIVNLLRSNLTLATSSNQRLAVLAPAGFDCNAAANQNSQFCIPIGQVTLPIPGSQSGHSFQINVDHYASEKSQFRYRFGYDRQRVVQAGGGGLKFNNFVAIDSRLFSMNWLKTISSNVVNDLRLSYRRVLDSRPLVDPAVTDFPNITINSLAIALGPNGNLPQGTPSDNNYQVYESLTYINGAHTFKFGGEMRRLIFTSAFLPRARGDYIYSNLDLLLRDLKPDASNLRGVGSPNFVGNRFQWFFFGQDDWKILPNLTLNLGLRYEYSNLPRDAAAQELNALASVPGVIEFKRPRTDKDNFAPRVGLAWSPTWDNSIGRFLFGNAGQSSIRANAALSHFVNFQNLLLLSLPPQFQQESDGDTPGVGSNTQFLQNGGIPNVLIPASTPAGARAGTASFLVDQDTPYSFAFSLSYQRELTKNMTIEFRYLRTQAKGLPVQVRLNAAEVRDEDLAIPTFLNRPSATQLTGLRTFDDINNNSPTTNVPRLAQFGFQNVVTAFPTIGESKYDGGSVTLTRSLSRNLGFSAAYTFSKTTDNSTNELNTSALNPRRAQNGFNIDDEWGLSALDIPHRFVTSFTYDVPFFNNNQNAWVRGALGGWQVNGIFQAQSGQPITIRSGIDSNQNGDAAGDRTVLNPAGDANLSSAVRAVALIGGVVTDVPIGDGRTVGYYAINPNARYIQAGLLAKANAGRNTFRTRGFSSTDMVFLKNTRFGTDGRFNFQIGAEILDIFNQRPRTLFGLDVTTAAFGIAGNANFNNYDGLGNFTGRKVTMRAKFIF